MINTIQPGGSASYSSQVNRVNGNGEIMREQSVGLDNSSAELSLSDNALALQRTWQAVKDSPDIRTDAVEAVRHQLEVKTYRIDMSTLVDRLLPLIK